MVREDGIELTPDEESQFAEIVKNGERELISKYVAALKGEGAWYSYTAKWVVLNEGGEPEEATFSGYDYFDGTPTEISWRPSDAVYRTDIKPVESETVQRWLDGALDQFQEAYGEQVDV